jgi:hypothetical protein
VYKAEAGNSRKRKAGNCIFSTMVWKEEQRRQDKKAKESSRKITPHKSCRAHREHLSVFSFIQK